MLRKLEKYEILEEIGHGGMATVYRALDTVLDRLVALKVMHPHLRSAEEARRRFHREARSVARLRHPRVLEIYDFSGEGSTEAYIAAELLTGPTLKRWREDHPHDVPAEIAACIVIEIAKALEHAHQAGIVHRDVKPENVLLHENRTLKLTDFGIADMVDAQSMTVTGQILGSPGHMAPEQIEGKDTDARSDLFSLGTVLYYLATGRLPFTGRNPHQILKRIIDGEYADPLRVNPTIGGRLRAIIVKALERDPAARHQSARELIDELAQFIAEAGIADCEQTLERYLRDPEGVGASIREKCIDRMIELGARASDAGDVPAALDYYNRVLALDEGNERVLRLIERVGHDRRRRLVLVAAATLMAFGTASAGAAWALWPTEHRSDPPRAQLRSTDRPPLAIDSGLAEPADAGAAIAARDIVDAARAATRDPVRDPNRDPVRVVRPELPRDPRIVRLSPWPVNVSIAVDDGPLREYGSALRSVELPPGPHRFRVEPNEAIAARYRSEVFEVTIPPGEGEHDLALRLPLADARLFVRSSVHADVAVDGRLAGRTNGIIAIPMRRDEVNLRVRVSAAGYVAHEELVHFEAGVSQEIAVSLQPENEVAQSP